uniref:Uncharacterized protein n=1 Tax=Thermomicrobium roseum TaxID=500 RepID=A0A7C1WZY7_THERO
MATLRTPCQAAAQRSRGAVSGWLAVVGEGTATVGVGGILAGVGVGSDTVGVGLSADAVAVVATVVVGALGAGDGLAAGLLQATITRAIVAARITIHLLGGAIVRLLSLDGLLCLHQGGAGNPVYHSARGDKI